MKIQLLRNKVSDAPPRQLQIKGGKLIAIDGTEADFSAMPDGEYSLLQRDVHIDLRDSVHLLNNWGS